jgi:hypothetical protein
VATDRERICEPSSFRVDRAISGFLAAASMGSVVVLLRRYGGYVKSRSFFYVIFATIGNLAPVDPSPEPTPESAPNPTITVMGV